MLLAIVPLVVLAGLRRLAAFQGLPRLSDAEAPPTPQSGTASATSVEVPPAGDGADGEYCLFGPNRRKSPITDIAEDFWMLALNESGLSAGDISLYGCSVPKMPLYFLERVQALSHKKVHTFNFQGSYMWEYYRQVLPAPVWRALMEGNPGWNATAGNEGQTEARNWVVDFAKANFSDHDLLKITDADYTWRRLGPYDVSAPGKYHNTRAATIVTGDAEMGEEYHKYLVAFDEPYWEEMVGSNFTLCPGGDSAWSMRFYEAIMAGSIPVIKSLEYDIGMPRLWALWDIPYRYYVLDSGDELVYRQDWVDENLRLFVKYQTFREGDLHPLHSSRDAQLAHENPDFAPH